VHNFVCDAIYVLLGEQTYAEACPESGTSHMTSPFMTHPTPVSAADSCFDAKPNAERRHIEMSARPEGYLSCPPSTSITSWAAPQSTSLLCWPFRSLLSQNCVAIARRIKGWQLSDGKRRLATKP
jgi:hypothetical protein